jgi:hypothetical protein
MAPMSYCYFWESIVRSGRLEVARVGPVRKTKSSEEREREREGGAAMADALATLAPAEGPEEAPLDATATRRCGAPSSPSTCRIRFLKVFLPFRCLLAR